MVLGKTGGVSASQGLGTNLTSGKPIAVLGSDLSTGVISAGFRYNQSQMRGAFAVKTPRIPLLNLGFGAEVRTPAFK